MGAVRGHDGASIIAHGPTRCAKLGDPVTSSSPEVGSRRVAAGAQRLPDADRRGPGERHRRTGPCARTVVR
eukprot:3803285-Pyramimonas_sp.AAC.1